MARPIDVYYSHSPQDMEKMRQVIQQALERANASIVDDDEEDGIAAPPPVQIEPIDELIGIDPEVYRQINAALKAGVRHLMFYGPPGTGKTTIALRVGGDLAERCKLITGSADFTSQDILGGYIPLENGKLKFFPGVLLENFDKPLIFDELNRCDIDKVIGPLFTVLSGQSTTLPYLVDPSDEKSARIEIQPRGVPDLPRAFAPGPAWKLIATINSIDKASLYQMSYALTRRFAWIYVDVPKDTSGFIREYVARGKGEGPTPDGPVPLGQIWDAVNEVRPIGPAPILDVMRLIIAQNDGVDFLAPVTDAAQAEPYLDGFSVFVLPMLDGILRDQGEKIADALKTILKLNDEQAKRVKTRLSGLSI